MLNTVHYVIVGAFILLGIVFSQGKGAGLIAGYNTAPSAKKAEYDEKALCHFMGKLMFALAGCWLIIAISEIFKITILFWLGLGLFFAVITAGVIYMNTGKRFKK